MRKINRLSKAKLALIARVRDEWNEIILNPTPVDQAKVLEILKRLYAVAGKPAPRQIIHLGSPLQVVNTILKSRTENEQADAGNLARIRFKVFKHVLDLVQDRVPDRFRYQVSYQVRSQIREQVCKQIGITAGDLFYDSFGQKVVDQLFTQTRAQFNHSTRMQAIEDARPWIILHVRDSITGQIRDQVAAWNSAAAEFVLTYESEAISLFLNWNNIHVFNMQAFPDYALIRLGGDGSRFQPYLDLAKSCNCAFLGEDCALISANPEFIKLDDQNRLHSDTGPAIRYPDGFSVFAIHGVRVPGKVVVSPESITIAEIESEQNVEVRRVLINLYGTDRYLMDSGAQEIHRDDFGVLYRKDFPEDQSLVMVKVANFTPEPDGSFRDYFLRVPPEMERARQAVAWTFGREEDDYSPALQT